MLKTVIRSVMICMKKRPVVNQHAEIRLKALEISEKARSLASDFEMKINATKLALSHLVGEFCVGIIELETMMVSAKMLSLEIDNGITSGNDVLARQKISELKIKDRQIQQYLESLNMIRPKINDIHGRMENFMHQKGLVLMQVGALESRARFAETITRVSGIFDGDFGIGENMSRTVERFEAYSLAYEEVYSTKFDEDLIAINSRSEVDDELDRRKALIDN